MVTFLHWKINVSNSGLRTEHYKLVTYPLHAISITSSIFTHVYTYIHIKYITVLVNISVPAYAIPYSRHARISTPNFPWHENYYRNALYEFHNSMYAIHKRHLNILEQMQTILPRLIITGNSEIAVKQSATTSLQTLPKVVLVKCLWTIKPPSALCLYVKDSRQFYWPFWRFEETEFTTYCLPSTLYCF